MRGSIDKKGKKDRDTKKGKVKYQITGNGVASIRVADMVKSEKFRGTVTSFTNNAAHRDTKAEIKNRK